MPENCENDPNCMGFPLFEYQMLCSQFSKKKKKNSSNFKQMELLNLQNVYDETLKCYL